MLDLKADFEDSDLPWAVDIIDLNNLSDEFKGIVEDDKVRLPQVGRSDWNTVKLKKYVGNSCR